VGKADYSQVRLQMLEALRPVETTVMPDPANDPNEDTVSRNFWDLDDYQLRRVHNQKLLRRAKEHVGYGISWCGQTRHDCRSARLPIETWLPETILLIAKLRREFRAKNSPRAFVQARAYYLRALRENLKECYEQMSDEGIYNNRSFPIPAGRPAYCSQNMNYVISYYPLSERKRHFRNWFKSELTRRVFGSVTRVTLN
jgi:hypothetical protein